MLRSHRRNVLYSAVCALERRLAPMMAAQSRKALIQYCRRLAAAVKQSDEAQASAVPPGLSAFLMLPQQPASQIMQQSPRISDLQQLQTPLACGAAEPAVVLLRAGAEPSSNADMLLQTGTNSGLEQTSCKRPVGPCFDTAASGKCQLEPASSEPPAPSTPQKVAPMRPALSLPCSRQPQSGAAAQLLSSAVHHMHAAEAHEQSSQANELEQSLGEAEAIALAAACAFAAKPHVRIPLPGLLDQMSMGSNVCVIGNGVSEACFDDLCAHDVAHHLPACWRPCWVQERAASGLFPWQLYLISTRDCFTYQLEAEVQQVLP